MKTAHFKSRQRKKKLSHKGYYEHMSRQFISFIIIHSFFKSQLVKRLIERWCLLGGTMGSNIFWSLIWILTHYFTTDLSIFQMRGISIAKLVAQGYSKPAIQYQAWLWGRHWLQISNQRNLGIEMKDPCVINVRKNWDGKNPCGYDRG